jgi:hypothetical protein
MKYTKMTPVEFEVTHILAEMEPRYWEDAVVNGEPENDDAPTVPLRSLDTWRIKIDLSTGKITDWPEGVTASTHYKVCDAGVYTLLDADGNTVARKDGYVPDMLAPSGKGYGDYAIMDIGPDGVIANWKADLSYFERIEA